MPELKPLIFTRDDLTAALNAAVTEGQVDGDVWDAYEADNPGDSDATFEAAMQALDSWLTLNPVNNPTPGKWIGEQVTFTLVADVDGAIGGYEYRYRLRWPFHERNRPLTLGTDYVEWRHARGQHDGIEGVVDFLEGVQAEVNASIEGYNESLAAAKPQPADDKPEQSTLRARFTPEAWIRDYAVEVDAQGDQEWRLAAETVATFTTPESVLSHNLDDLRDDPFAPQWIRDWNGPFTIELLCDRHGGEWGDDDTCEDCTTEESTVRPPVPDAGLEADARLIRKANDDTPEVWL